MNVQTTTHAKQSWDMQTPYICFVSVASHQLRDKVLYLQIWQKKLKILKKCFLILETDWRFFIKYKEKWACII